MEYTVFGADESWLPVVGFEGYFEVSSYGSVRSVPRKDRMGRAVRGGVRALNLDGAGYPIVTLKVDGKSFRYRVHVLVLAAFHGAKPADHEGCHRDDVKTDNRAWRLYWGSRSDNVRDSYRTGGKRHITKTHCPSGHPYSGDNLRWDTEGYPRCRECTRQRSYAAWLRRRAVT